MNFDELLRSLHQEYLSSLPKKIEGIRTQWESGDVAALRESFHKLKGTGRTYGMPEISELCAAVEEICIDHGEHALTAVSQALPLLQSIFTARTKHQEYALEQDPRFDQIRKLLQN